MDITSQEVKKIANLARLGLSEAEVEAATHDLSNILGHFSTIQKVDVSTISDSPCPFGHDEASPFKGGARGGKDTLLNVTRNDEAQPNILCSADNLLANAPFVQGRHLKVKAVFQEETL